MNDLKFALRQLLKNPGFTARPSCRRFGGQAVAVLTLALGIGASTARPIASPAFQLGKAIGGFCLERNA